MSRLQEFCAARSAPFPEDVSVRWAVDFAANEQEDGSEVSPSSVGETQRRQLSPSRIRAEVEAFEELGVTRLVLDLPPSQGQILKQLRRFAGVVAL